MKNLRRLACKFDLDQSERKSTQVHASPGQTKSQVDPSLQLASTCVSVWPGLKRYQNRFDPFKVQRALPSFLYESPPPPPKGNSMIVKHHVHTVFQISQETQVKHTRQLHDPTNSYKIYNDFVATGRIELLEFLTDTYLEPLCT